MQKQTLSLNPIHKTLDPIGLVRGPADSDRDFEGSKRVGLAETGERRVKGARREGQTKVTNLKTRRTRRADNNVVGQKDRSLQHPLELSAVNVDSRKRLVQRGDDNDRVKVISKLASYRYHKMEAREEHACGESKRSGTHTPM